MTSLEEAIEKGIDKSGMVFAKGDLYVVAEAVRAWAKEESCNFETFLETERVPAVPLDKFGGES